MNEKEIRQFLWKEGAGRVIVDAVVKDIRERKAQAQAENGRALFKAMSTIKPRERK